MTRILIVDDNLELAELLSRSLKRKGYSTDTSFDGEDALKKIGDSFFDIVLTDIRIPKIDGMDLLKRAKTASPASIVIMMTAFGTVEQAVAAMREGAFDYMMKPFSADEVELKIKSSIEQQMMKAENQMLKETLATRYGPMVGRSAKMQEIYGLIDKVAPTNAQVLILGKSGTGKELVAHEIHNRSKRANGPFIVVNCVALAEGILESELFGHEKGSFTGAIAMRRGKFEVANGGTLLLDEIGELNDNLQVKMLRFLQEKEFQRVGGNNTIKVDVRIIAATNKDIQAAILSGAFREDLFYRLNHFTLNMPSLKERLEDMDELIGHYILKFNKEFGKNLKVSPQSIAAMKQYEWPGNIRELENVMAQAAIMVDGDYILPRHLSFIGKNHPVGYEEASVDTSNGISFHIGMIEQEMVKQALIEAKWNQVKAARKLGLKRTSLQYKMQKYGLISPKKET